MSESMKLTEEQIVECLRSLNCPVRLSDLKTPTKEFVVNVFQYFLKDLQINIASQLLRPFEAVKHLENPELYEHGHSLILLSLTMTEILRYISTVSTLTISVNDICNPKPKKTKKILNYLIIFWNYYLTKFDMFQKTEQSLKPQLEKSQQMKRENEILEEQYEECLDKLRNFEPPKEELYQTAASKKEKEAHFGNIRKEVLEEYQHLKKQEHQLQTELSNIDVEIVTAKEKLNELDELIIASPEKICSEVQRIKDMIKEVELKIQDKEDEKKSKKKTYQALESAKEDAMKSILKQQKTVEDFHSPMDAVQKVRFLYNQCEEESKNLSKLLSDQQVNEVMANFYEEKTSKIQMKKEKRTKEIATTLEELENQKLKEKEILDKQRAADGEIQDKIIREANSLNEIVEKSKLAAAETKRMKLLYESSVNKLKSDFANNCEEIIEEARKY